MIALDRYSADRALRPAGRLVLPFEARCKSRLRARLDSGEDVGIFLEPGTVLRGGDRLQGGDGRVIEVVAAREPLMEVWSASPQRLARIAYHLGNRHTLAQIGEGWLRFPSDRVLRDMIVGLGADVREVEDAFEPEAGAYAHSHGESSGRIHQYRRGA